MSKLELIYVSSKVNVYGQEEYSIKERDGNFECRGSITNRELAYKIAADIDARMVYERDNGAGSLDVI